MGTVYDPSKFVHRLAGPAAQKPGLRSDSWPAAFSDDGRKQPVLSNSVGRERNDLIFHSLIVSGERLGLRNPWATFGSLIFQFLLLSAVAVIPLFHVDPLPKRERPTMVYLQAPPQTASIATKIRAPKPLFTHTPTRTPISTPVHMTQEASPAPVDTTNEVAAGAVSGVQDGAPTEMLSGPRIVAAASKAPEPTPAKRIRVASGVAEANLIHDVPPQYPPEAGRERVEGMVVLLAVIGTDGTVKDVRVESGPALLAQAAIDAVKQWRYRPYLLNGIPVEIDSRITINFTMSRG